MTVTEIMQDQQIFNTFMTTTSEAFISCFMKELRRRINNEFDRIIENLKQFPVDDKLNDLIAQKIKKFDYPKQQILDLFKSLNYSVGNGNSMNVDIYVEHLWDYEFIKKMNQSLGIEYPLPERFFRGQDEMLQL